ncbi:MAG: Endonuclease III [Firmicutes bacterium]|nr:Endonuclease III [candidate division NPL-UPA2 bacterium]
MVTAAAEWESVVEELCKLYPDARCELNFANPFQLLVATVLSAQCTDVRVNEVTAKLFAKYTSAYDLLPVEQQVLEEELRSLGLFRHKARNILALCRVLCERFGGEVPRTIDELVALPGVGRKTANVVVNNAFGVPALAVDTHVFRVAMRLGWARGKTPLAVEAELCRLLPQSLWGDVHHLLIWHGRRVCHARSPVCETCSLRAMCRTGRGDIVPSAQCPVLSGA